MRKAREPDRSWRSGARTGRVVALVVACLALLAGPAQAQDAAALQREISTFADRLQYREARAAADRLVAMTLQWHGAGTLPYANALMWQAVVSSGTQRYGEMLDYYGQALAVYERHLGPDHLDNVNPLSGMCSAYLSLRRFREATQSCERGLAIAERNYGPEDPRLVSLLMHLGRAYDYDWQLADGKDKAQAVLLRGLAIVQRTAKPGSPEILDVVLSVAEHQEFHHEHRAARQLYDQLLDAHRRVHNVFGEGATLQKLAELDMSEGRDQEAVAHFERALEIVEAWVRTPAGKGRIGVILYGQMLSGIAPLYLHSGRPREATAAAERALAIAAENFPPDAAHLAQPSHILGYVYFTLGRLAEARPLFERAAAIRIAASGENSEFAATHFSMLATVQRAQGDFAGAADSAERAYRITETLFGPEAARTAQEAVFKAGITRAAGRLGEAKSLLATASDRLGHKLGTDNPAAASALADLAAVECALGETHPALGHARDAGKVFAARLARLGVTQGPSQAVYGVEATPALLCAAFAEAGRRPADRLALASEALVAASAEQHTAAAAAVAQMAARVSAGNAKLAEVTRRQQDLVQAWRAIDSRLTDVRSDARALQDPALITRLRKERAEIEREAASVTATLARDFPDYAALADPRPLTIAEIQQLLGPDEALAAFAVGPDASYVWAITAEGWDWQRISIGRQALAKEVAGLRRPLDLWATAPRGLVRLTGDDATCAPADTRALARPDGASAPACAEGGEFSLARAHNLYALLLAPVAKVLAGKQNLMLVPSGPLTGLPFNALVTEAPAEGTATSLAAMRSAPWLIRRHALTVLPAIGSLAALRRAASSSRATKPFVGFGDPDFAGTAGKTRGKRRKSESVVAAANASAATPVTRGLSEYFRGGVADVEALRTGLPRLPDTGPELEAIAATLGAASTDVVLGPAASEATVKRMNAARALADFRVVAFATHGLVAGEVAGLAEPAIALTVPAKASAVDDGLLTASEAASLDLDADWVILSACNTAAGGAPDAEALSGLARAFFYAGTRALLVSHWPVESAAAVKLTTGTFKVLAADPAQGRAAAFRTSMLALIDSGEAYQAHPAYWAPYFVVGEGGAGR